MADDKEAEMFGYLRAPRVPSPAPDMRIKKKVSIVGSGNWGSAIARHVGNKVIEKSHIFRPDVKMYMYEEKFEGRKLTEVVNERHENVKYLPGFKFSDNVVAVPNVVDATKDADILIFVLPHQFVRQTCKIMQEHVKDTAIAISLIKGFDMTPDGRVELISKIISDILNIDCAVMMGATLAHEVAEEQFSEATIACSTEEQGLLLKELFQAPFFKIVIVYDRETVEMCGALKNIVGIGCGICDGMGLGHNTKSAVLRLGLMEMVQFGVEYIPGCKVDTFFESCGIADLVATCHGGRNRMLGEAVIKEPEKTIRQLEKEILRGQSFQGPLVAKEIYTKLKERNRLDRFPLFTAIHRICIREMDPREFINCLRDHPEHM